MSRRYLNGKGAQFNPNNQFLKTSIEFEAQELQERKRPGVEVLHEQPKSILSRNNSSDLHFDFSINPYQGCEHGCSYCYARVTHEYWGLSSGLDFETKIMVKENAPQLLRKQLQSKKWKGELIMFSGNTDCYQPLERKYQLTRTLLSICLEHKQVVNIITKNYLILRDLDILREMARQNLVEVCISITTVQEELRRKLEPRTSTAKNRFRTLEQLQLNGVPTSVLIAPVIPGLNQIEIPEIIKRSYEAGAYTINYATVRLNGTVADVFEDWLKTHFPERSEKVWRGIARLHEGNVSANRIRTRMRGKGPEAEAISQLFNKVKNRYFSEVQKPQLDYSRFNQNLQTSLF